MEYYRGLTAADIEPFADGIIRRLKNRFSELDCSKSNLDEIWCRFNWLRTKIHKSINRYVFHNTSNGITKERLKILIGCYTFDFIEEELNIWRRSMHDSDFDFLYLWKQYKTPRTKNIDELDSVTASNEVNKI